MARREFGEYCGLARALELVGERWALLIVRELLTRPCRYTDLLEDLPGIPTNVLASRLKELEEAGIAERRLAPAPQRGVVYGLTADGQQLEPAVLALARWGTAHLGEKRPEEIVPASTVAMGLRAVFRPDESAGLTAAFEIRAAGRTVYAVCADGKVDTGVGPAPDPPDLVIGIAADEMPGLREILLAVAGGEATLDGPKELAGVFTRVFNPAR